MPSCINLAVTHDPRCGRLRIDFSGILTAPPVARMANYPDLMPWTAPIGCVEHHRGLIERHVNAKPAFWRQEPVVGEVFASRKEAEARIQLFALVTGFDVVTRGGGNARSPAVEIRCIHHGEATRNVRGLEDRVVRDPEGKITSARKREGTSVRQTGCKWRIRVSFIKISPEADAAREWRLTQLSSTHEGHLLVDNPFTAYPAHRPRLEEFQEVLLRAMAHRRAKIVYSDSRRILESEEFAWHLSSSEFYNTVRNQRAEKSDEKSVLGLLTELSENGWLCETRSEVFEDNNGQITGRKLLQVWFTHPRLMEATIRFVSDFALLIDGTFNTNKLKMPLLIAVGQLNSGKTFPIAFSWCPEEDETSYSFFWRCLKDHSFRRPFNPSCAFPRVIIGDQNAGLTASIPRAFPEAEQQICDWHAVQSMEKKMRDLGTPSNDIKQVYKAKCWAYITSMTEQQLDTNRRDLGTSVGPLFMKYLQETWIPKEQKVIYLYTFKYANLGASSSQRSESYHDTITELVTAQLTLKDSAKRLMAKVDSIIKDINQDEALSAASYSRLAQVSAFRDIRMRVSKYAISRLENEWTVLDLLLRGGQSLSDNCRCEIRLRYGLACRHYLKKAYDEGVQLPKTLVHPRWWLNGPNIYHTNWVPFYPSPELTSAPLQPEVEPSMAAQLAAIRGQLNAMERHRFDVEAARVERQVATYQDLSMTSLLRATERVYQMQQIPHNQPDARRQDYFARRSAHGPANQRALISNELAERRERSAHLQQLQLARQQDTQVREQAMDRALDLTGTEQRPFEEGEDTIEIMRQKTPDNIPESLPGAQEITPLPVRTPERPRPRRLPSPEASPTIVRPTKLPASTAPPVLGRAKRRRQHTAKFTAGRQQGFIPESQERQ